MADLIDSLRTSADGASDAWDDAPERFRPVLNAASDLMTEAADEIKRLRVIIDAQQAVIDYYEGEHDRFNYADEDVPEELRELEQQLQAANDSA